MWPVYAPQFANSVSSPVLSVLRAQHSFPTLRSSDLFANFGIAMAARMPIITTTIRSSISVKPLRFVGKTSLERLRVEDTSILRRLGERIMHHRDEAQDQSYRPAHHRTQHLLYLTLRA